MEGIMKMVVEEHLVYTNSTHTLPFIYQILQNALAREAQWRNGWSTAR